MAELVAPGVLDEKRLAGRGHGPCDAAADRSRRERDLPPRLRGHEVTAEGDQPELVALAEGDAAVVVVDEEPELVRDGEPDLCDVVESRQLPGQALEHLQVCDRAQVVPADVFRGRALER